MNVHPQIISQNGTPAFVVLPYKEYQTILETLEDIIDIQTIEKSQQDKSERFPLALVQAIANGEHAIKVFREYRKLSQTQLAKYVNVSRQYISQLENNERVGTTKILKAIAKALALDLDDIA